MIIDKQAALEIRQQALTAISELSRLLQAGDNQVWLEEYNTLKLGVGLCIGAIDQYLLSTVYKEYPEMKELE